jgi:hypothetical protein
MVMLLVVMNLNFSLRFDDGEEVGAVGGEAEEAVADGGGLTRRREGAKGFGEGGGGADGLSRGFGKLYKDIHRLISSVII